MFNANEMTKKSVINRLRYQIIQFFIDVIIAKDEIKNFTRSSFVQQEDGINMRMGGLQSISLNWV